MEVTNPNQVAEQRRKTKLVRIHAAQRINTAKLTEEDVRLIRALGKERLELIRQARALSNAAIAEKFDVSPDTISKVLNCTTWRYFQ